MNNLKLLETTNDIVIESLKELITDLQIRNKFKDNQIKLLKDELQHFYKYSEFQSEFKCYLIYKKKLEDVLDSQEYDNLNIEDIQFEWNLAVKDKDIRKMEELFDKLIKYQSPELLGIIEEQNQEIIDLKDELEDYKE